MHIISQVFGLHFVRQIVVLLFVAVAPGFNCVWAQTAEWKYMHKGNRAFEAEDYSEAELNYLKVLAEKPDASRALFNLGNVHIAKNNAQVAYDYFEQALKYENDSLVKSMAYHNQGYIYHAAAMSSTKEAERQQLLQLAIERYKESLRRNPNDEDTRYNLALCQKLLKPSPSQSDQSDKKGKDSNSPDNSSNQQQQQEQPQQQNSQTEREVNQLLNLSRQAEKRAKQKVDRALQNPRQKHLEKNW